METLQTLLSFVVWHTMKNLVMGSIGVWDWLKTQCKSGIIAVLGIAFVLYTWCH